MLRDLGTVRADDESRRLLAVFLRGAADDRHVLDARHGAKEILNLLRRDVLAATDDEVLETTGDVVVAVRIHPANVAGVEPAVCVDTLRRLLGHLIVALHRVEAAAADLAIRPNWSDLARLWIDNRDLHAWERLSDRLALAFERGLEVARHRHHRSRFRQSVRVRDLTHEHLVVRLLHAMGRAG